MHSYVIITLKHVICNALYGIMLDMPALSCAFKLHKPHTSNCQSLFTHALFYVAGRKFSLNQEAAAPAATVKLDDMKLSRASFRTLFHTFIVCWIKPVISWNQRHIIIVSYICFILVLVLVYALCVKFSFY